MKFPDGVIFFFDLCGYTKVEVTRKELVCCGSCIHADGEHRRCTCPGGLTGELGELDFCSKGENDGTNRNKESTLERRMVSPSEWEED